MNIWNKNNAMSSIIDDIIFGRTVANNNKYPNCGKGDSTKLPKNVVKMVYAM